MPYHLRTSYIAAPFQRPLTAAAVSSVTASTTALLLAFSTRLLARSPALRKTAKIKWSVRFSRGKAAVHFPPSITHKSRKALTEFWRRSLLGGRTPC